jgi:predicted outer membrane repeat protein
VLDPAESVLSGFSASRGAAFHMDSVSKDRLPSLSLELCVIRQNQATEYGAALYASNAPVRLENVTLADNGARDVAVRGEAAYSSSPLMVRAALERACHSDSTSYWSADHDE